MTRKHFEAMAKIFNEAMRNAENGAVGRIAVWDGVVLPFARYAKTQNPNFNEERFLDAVDYPQYV